MVASFGVSLTLCIIGYNWTFRRGTLARIHYTTIYKVFAKLLIHQPGALAGLSSSRKAVQSFRDDAMDFRVPASPREMVYDCTDATEDRTSIPRSNRGGSGDSEPRAGESRHRGWHT